MWLNVVLLEYKGLSFRLHTDYTQTREMELPNRSGHLKSGDVRTPRQEFTTVSDSLKHTPITSYFLSPQPALDAFFTIIIFLCINWWLIKKIIAVRECIKYCNNNSKGNNQTNIQWKRMERIRCDWWWKQVSTRQCVCGEESLLLCTW